MASFFIVLMFVCPLANTVKAAANDALWSNLLHVSKGKSLLDDERYFFSGVFDEPELEREASKQALLPEGAEIGLICNFPARYTFFLNDLDKSNAVLEQCEGLQEFIKHVPADYISLVFSSENLTSPSSMMGHILIKITGLDDKGLSRNHAVSFFTKLNSVNVPKIMFDSLVVGKEGYFIISPYAAKLDFYLNGEERNVWEYKLNLTVEQKTLLLLHLWELKQIKLKYFFDDYNCATLTQQLIKIMVPEVVVTDSSNITPIDVVKLVNNNDLVSDITVRTAPKWRARMLSDQLGSVYARRMANAFKNQEYLNVLDGMSSDEKFLAVELVKDYDFILNSKNQGTSERTDKTFAWLNNNKNDKSLFLDLSKYKNPTKTPPDSQWSLGLALQNGNVFQRITYMPASHEIYDDNSQYFSENELKLSAISVLVNNKRIIIDEVSLYSVKSIIPTVPLLGGLSGRFNVAYLRREDKQLNKRGVFDISGAAGKTITFGSSIDVYALLGAGIGLADKTLYGYTEPELGVIVREKYGFKTHVEFGYRWNEFNDSQGLGYFKIRQSKFFNDNFGLFVGYKRVAVSQGYQEEFDLDVKYYF